MALTGSLQAPDAIATGHQFLPRSIAIWSVAGYIALFVIRPWEILIPELAPFHLERTYAIMMIGLLLLSGRAKTRLDTQSVTVLLFVAATVASSVMAWQPELAWPKLYEYLTLVVFYFVLVESIRAPNELVFLVVFYLAVEGVYLGKAQWEYFVHGAGTWAMGVIRLQGIERTFGHPNSVAASAILTLPLLAFVYAIRARVCASWSRQGRRLFALGLYAYAVLVVTSVMLTRSRAGAVMLVSFALLLAARTGNLIHKLPSLLLAGVVSVATFFVLPADMQDRIRTLWAPESANASAFESMVGRWEGYLAGMEMFRTYPIFGVGLGNFSAYRVSKGDGVDLNAHNLWGEVLGETGLVGAVALLALLATIVFNGIRIERATAERSDTTSLVLNQWRRAAIESIALLLIAGMAAHNLTRFNWLWVAALTAIAADIGCGPGRGAVARRRTWRGDAKRTDACRSSA